MSVGERINEHIRFTQLNMSKIKGEKINESQYQILTSVQLKPDLSALSTKACKSITL